MFWLLLAPTLAVQLTSRPPFHGKTENELQKNICNQKIKYPTFLESATVSLLKGVRRNNNACLSPASSPPPRRSQLLQRNVPKRLAVAAIKQHAYFRTVNWTVRACAATRVAHCAVAQKMLERAVPPPYVPTLTDVLDTRHFDDGAQAVGACKRSSLLSDFVNQNVSESPADSAAKV